MPLGLDLCAAPRKGRAVTETLLPRRLTLVPVALLAFTALAACDAAPPEPVPAPDSRPTRGPLGNAAGGESQKAQPDTPTPPPKGKVAGKPVAQVKPAPDDPLQGKWTLEDATKGLPPGKTIVATLDTDQGKLECKLFDDKAPITVANFVGLARGNRPWKTPEGKWEKKPAYDGGVFHRIIKGFMSQGGDPQKRGSGDAGYEIPDEIWEGGSHDRPGLLCMANRGPNTNSMQFFITDAAVTRLDGGYTIFGECGPEEIVHKLASVPVNGERPVNPPVIKSISVTRK
jgi:peptidyl-prolyl cis-trans isomerase A (cyclophilin A)